MPRESEPATAYAARVLLAACRDHVRHWTGVQTVLASYAVDPARLGQRMIKHAPGAAWRCSRCGHQTQAFSLNSPSWPPTRCRRCRLCGTMERVETTLYFLAPRARGRVNPFQDPYSVTNFVLSLYRWAELVTREPHIGLVLDLWSWGLSERQIAEGSVVVGLEGRVIFRRSDTWVHRRLVGLEARYEA